jgi:hypothetical protein
LRLRGWRPHFQFAYSSVLQICRALRTTSDLCMPKVVIVVGSLWPRIWPIL